MYRSSPYETTACKNHKVDDTVRTLQQMLIMNRLHQNDKVFMLYDDSELREFNQPLVIDNPNDKMQKAIIVDLRKYMSMDANTGTWYVKRSDVINHRIQLVYGALCHIWSNSEPTRLMGVSQFLPAVFGTWIAESIAKRYSLMLNDTMAISVLGAAYYLRLFNREQQAWTESDLVYVSEHLQRLFPSKTSESIIDIIHTANFTVADIRELCTAIRNVTENIRLKDLDTGVLLTLITKTWFGHYASEMIAVALEYPPAFLTIVHACKSEKLYRTTGINLVIDRIMKNDRDFLLRFNDMVNEIIHL